MCNSGDARARKIAAVSSIPGSVSMMTRFVVTSACSISLDVALHLAYWMIWAHATPASPMHQVQQQRQHPSAAAGACLAPPTPAVSCVRQPLTPGEDLPA